MSTKKNNNDFKQIGFSLLGNLKYTCLQYMWLFINWWQNIEHMNV